MTIPTFLFATWMSAFIVGLLAFLALRSPTIGLVAGGAAMLLPYMVIKFQASRRMWKFEEQFPEAIDLIARSLRAGHSFPNGLLMVADEISAPVGPEFKLIYDRQNFGMPLPEALRAFAKRIPVIDAKFFVTAVLTQREAGGNLSGVLDNLSAVIRERFKVKRQISVISAHGRMTAAVLAGLPPFVAVAQAVITPQNFALMVNDPLGQYMLIGAFCMQVLGMLVIRKIIQIPY
jgi:tight adherence protein B